MAADELRQRAGVDRPLEPGSGALVTGTVVQVDLAAKLDNVRVPYKTME